MEQNTEFFIQIPTKHKIQKTKTEFKRDSLTRYNAYNNLLVYFLSYYLEIHALKFYKSASKIVRFLLISHIIYKNKEIYRYDKSNMKLSYTDLKSGKNIEYDDVSNTISDIQRRQVNILVSIAEHFGIQVDVSRANLKKSSIEKWNIKMISFYDKHLQQHILIKDNVEDYYNDLTDVFNYQMKGMDKFHREFIVKNDTHIYQYHSPLPSVVVSNPQLIVKKPNKKKKEVYEFYDSISIHQEFVSIGKKEEILN